MKDTEPKECFAPSNDAAPERLLLHACCGPCSTEPLRVLKERGIDLAVHYSNSNIAPHDEYEHRLSTLKDFMESEGIEVIEDAYDNSKWQDTAGKIGAAEEGSEKRRARCRACYRQRLEASAAYAKENDFDAVGTTLSVSPYQYTDIIHEELDRACAKFGLKAFFEDYSPLYPETTRRSREAGMYRQDYCGCLLSKEEADEGRAKRAAERKARRAERAKANAAKEAQLEHRRKERREYDAKQARKRAVLKELRAKEKDAERDS